jgi:hypothetical protein
MSIVRVYLPLNTDAKCLGSARTSDVPHVGLDCGGEAWGRRTFSTNLSISNKLTNVEWKKTPKKLGGWKHRTFWRRQWRQPSFVYCRGKYRIFAFQKLLKCVVGDVKSAKQLQNSAVVIEITWKAQADKALKMTILIDVHIIVSPHRSFNMSRGIIRCRDLRDCSDKRYLMHWETWRCDKCETNFLKTKMV